MESLISLEKFNPEQKGSPNTLFISSTHPMNFSPSKRKFGHGSKLSLLSHRLSPSLHRLSAAKGTDEPSKLTQLRSEKREAFMIATHLANKLGTDAKASTEWNKQAATTWAKALSQASVVGCYNMSYPLQIREERNW